MNSKPLDWGIALSVLLLILSWNSKSNLPIDPGSGLRSVIYYNSDQSDSYSQSQNNAITALELFIEDELGGDHILVDVDQLKSDSLSAIPQWAIDGYSKEPPTQLPWHKAANGKTNKGISYKLESLSDSKDRLADIH